MRVQFYQYRQGNPNADAGTITLENGRLSFPKRLSSTVKRLLDGLDVSDIASVEQALEKANQVYDGLYLRAEVVSE